MAISSVAVLLAALMVAQHFSYRPEAMIVRPDAPRVVVVQPNVPQDERGESDGEMMLAKLAALSGKPALSRSAAHRLIGRMPPGKDRHG